MEHQAAHRSTIVKSSDVNSEQEKLKSLQCWLQEDAAYCYVSADKFRGNNNPVDNWIACLVQDAAAHSARCSRVTLGIEEMTDQSKIALANMGYLPS
jgi:hypothetical protein